jgi:hypothetical protein
MKTVVALVLLVLWLPLQAQDTTTRTMDTVNISSSLLRLKTIGLYDVNLQATDDEIGGFAALSLFVIFKSCDSFKLFGNSKPRPPSPLVAPD